MPCHCLIKSAYLQNHIFCHVNFTNGCRQSHTHCDLCHGLAADRVSVQGVMFGLQASEEEVGECLMDEEDSIQDQIAQGLLQLLNDSASTRSSCASQFPAATRLSLAILEPLSRLVSPLLVSLQDRPSDAQVLVMPQCTQRQRRRIHHRISPQEHGMTFEQ